MIVAGLRFTAVPQEARFSQYSLINQLKEKLIVKICSIWLLWEEEKEIQRILPYSPPTPESIFRVLT